MPDLGPPMTQPSSLQTDRHEMWLSPGETDFPGLGRAHIPQGTDCTVVQISPAETNKLEDRKSVV